MRQIRQRLELCCRLLTCLAVVVTALTAPRAAAAQSGFVYKGTLIVGGVKVTGTYDFAFSLWDAPTGGAQVAIVNKNAVAVNTGAYSVTIDFGAKSFSGAPLYMQIQYRKTGTATWSTISGRLLLSVRFSIVAQSAMGLQGRPVNAIAPANGQVLKWNGSSWAPAADTVVVYSAGAGLALAGATFSIAPLGVTSAMLASSAVTTPKIATGAVTPAKLQWPFVQTASNAGYLLRIENTGAGHGILGTAQGGDGVAGTSKDGFGVYAFSENDYGLRAASINSNAIYAYSANTGAIFAEAPNSTVIRAEAGGNRSAIKGISPSGYGVDGVSTSSAGVAGLSTNGFGLYGYCADWYGVLGISQTSYAGYFNGPLTATSKQFTIDHPLDPTNKTLHHACVESSEMLNTYSGNVTTDAEGSATVTLPDWFESLNENFRYQLTPIGQFAQAIVGNEIADGRFTIRTDKPNVKVSWQVTGARKDAYAKANPLRVEQLKPDSQRGKLLHPTAFGQPESMGAFHEHIQRAKSSR